MTTAVRMFFTRVRNDRAIPFEIRVSEEPNEETRRAILYDERISVNSIDELLGQYDNEKN